MKIKFLLGLVLSFGAHSLNAQTTPWCATDQHFQSQVETNPALETEMHEQLLRANSGIYYDGDREEYVIPVVVHVLHNNGVGNITEAQILSGIQMLNEDFNRTNEDATETRETAEAPFLGYAAAIGVRFELAKLDPDGNCTNGIQRRNVGSRSYNAGENAKHDGSGGLDAWNRNYYFNIWIVNSIQSGGGGTTLGYAEFPYGGGSSTYGVIIRNDSYGTIGTASGDRTISHEVGHCLGLLHTFQGGCHSNACNANGDYCCDTPPVAEPLWSCVTSQNSCNEIPTGDTYVFDAVDQFENFMSYSPCQNMFSADQKTIVLGNLESISFLNNLVDPANNATAGVGLPAVLCKAQFDSDTPIICQGGDLAFRDDSYHNVTEWNWTFEGGSPASSSEENPIINYNTPGVYSVTLEVSDGISTVSSTVVDYVVVLANPGTGLPYSENFESLVSIPDFNHFLIVDEDESASWTISDLAGYSGTRSAYLANRGVNNSTLDELISGSIDLSDVDTSDNIVFSFKYAYVKRNASNDEWLRFYISKDCGETWTLRKNIHNDDLSSTVQNAAYTPTSLDEWRTVVISNIYADYYTSGFRYKFQFENDNGNNIYIDDINMYSGAMVGIAEEKIQPSISVYPNPTLSETQIHIASTVNETYTIKAYNAFGACIELIYEGDLTTGEHYITWNTEALAAGIYTLHITAGNEIQTIRIVKE